MNKTVGPAVLAVLLLAAGRPDRLTAQDSQFGIRGLGTPGRWESVRARATGGAFAPFDPFSPLLDAAIADLRRLSAGVTGGTSWRAVEIGGSETSLRSSRFPTLVLGGPLSRRVAVAGGFTTYLDKSFGVVTSGIDTLRGEIEPRTDEITSDGAVADLRVAVAARVHSRLALGVALHRLTGSTRVTAVRRFEDSVSYRTSTLREDVAYGGVGGSASALLDLTSALRLAAWVRSDTRLAADVRGRTTAEDDLPFAAGGGAAWRPGTKAVIAGAVAWRFWAGAGPDSYDTFTWSVGAELGSGTAPLRFGVRGGDLPFGPGGAAPTELAIAAGIGRQFSGGRGRLDFGVERLERKGAALTERVWTLLLGLTVRP